VLTSHWCLYIGGLELVSPILRPETPEVWNAHLNAVFGVLRKHFTLAASSSCGTHVHVSTVPALGAAHLAAVAKAILLFEPALDALVPAARASPSSYWCQSNAASQALRSLSPAQRFDLIDCCPDVPSVVRAMCLFPARSAYGRAHGYTEDFVHGVYK
jgi:hypothetical protein